MEGNVDSGSTSMIGKIVEEIIYSPLNIALVTVCVVLIYKIFSGRKSEASPPPPPELPPLKRRDMTLKELRIYDGSDPDGRICVAVNGKVFDVTKGKRFYGPGGPYSAFAGKDASRGLATFTVETPKEDEFDDLSDLNQMEMEGVREWEMQFMEKYHYVGRLLRPNEEPTEYSDEENVKKEEAAPPTEEKSKDN